MHTAYIPETFSSCMRIVRLSHQATNFLNHLSMLTIFRFICVENGVVVLKLACSVLILYVGLI